MNPPARDTEPAAKGEVIFAPELFTRPHDPAEEPMLRGSECPTCKAVFFPARTVCPRCFEEGALKVRELSGRGRIYASTVVMITAPIGIKAPYAYGYVDLADSGLRVFALFSGADPGWFVPGRDVELTVGPIRLNQAGQEVIGSKFRPADKG
jgi:uncharacterized OB-fold protein